jgi:TPP-dependent pyruvate/acetoin dehydrogenase alpha subunit
MAWTAEELKAFETDIGDSFNRAEIRAPIHLYDGNEEAILKVFECIDIEKDWVCATWRNHYQCLLKGVPPEYLKDRILAGKSMVMNLPEYKIHCSSIVGGIPSIATGIAAANKMKGNGEWVWCWLGDMSAETGAFAEALKYARAQKLPITFVIEDNELSVETPTAEVWGTDKWYLKNPVQQEHYITDENVVYYKYKNTRYPHAGAGVRVQF